MRGMCSAAPIPPLIIGEDHHSGSGFSKMGRGRGPPGFRSQSSKLSCSTRPPPFRRLSAPHLAWSLLSSKVPLTIWGWVLVSGFGRSHMKGNSVKTFSQ